MAIPAALFCAAAVTALLLLGPASAGFPLVTQSLGEPWPKPQQAEMYATFSVVAPTDIRFRTTKKTCQDLEDALKRYQDLLASLATTRRHQRDNTLLKMLFSTRGPLTDVEVWMDADCTDNPLPTADMSEEYVIKINTTDAPGRAQIISNSLWGAYRGLETFTHLLYFSQKHGQFHLRHGMIRDYPRFSHRGLMLDTSRHFISLDSIRATLDLMAFNKFNVFHWHIVDGPSFPFESTTFPSLSAQGAYRSEFVYSVQDVADVVEYARQRGIRVIPEFDTPGHVRSWGAGMPGLLTTCYNETTGLPDGTYGPLDPSKASTYALVKQLLTEVTNRFPDKYVHLGGDEVSFGFACWLSNPDVQQWMEALNLTTPEEVENEYIQKLLVLVENLPAKPEYVVWQEVIDNNITVRPSTIVQVWKGGWEDEMAKVTALGQRAILSSCWYLNYISYGVDWPQYYECEPESFNGTEAQKALVMGGEAAMWSEYVDDTNVVSRTWPRATVVAERLWSARDVTSDDETAPRLEENRCRLLQRGYPVEPANGPGFC